MRKILTLLLLLVLVVTAVPALAFADDEPSALEEYTGEFRKITTDGTWEVNSVKPKTASEGFIMLSELADNAIDTKNYYSYVFFDEENFNPEKATVGAASFSGEYSQEHNIDIVYKEPSQERIKEVEEIISEIDFKDKYSIEDLANINFIDTYLQYRTFVSCRCRRWLSSMLN